MKSWPVPFLPEIPGTAPTVRVRDTRGGELREVVPTGGDGEVRVYACGITPYDATHMGHAATYLTIDLLVRVLRDAGHEVRYVQNITDIDDPLLERAEADGIDWRDLGTREIALFREDMTALAVIPPDEYLGAVESIPTFVPPIEELARRGIVYAVEAVDASRPGSSDWYFDVAADPDFGSVSGLDTATMLALFAERGGDPGRTGKRGPLDPLMWRAHRDGEPEWNGGTLGSGRPGWHIECACIARDHLGLPFDVQAGGTDLIFPHHEMSASHGRLLAGTDFAGTFLHQAMVGYDGEKMSKSKGNLVLVSALRADGVDPMAIRLALLAQPHHEDWEWTDAVLDAGLERLARWRAGLSGNGGPEWERTVEAVRAAMANGLDGPAALAAVDEWVGRALDGDDGTWVEAAPGMVSRAIDRVLGIRV